MKAKNGVERGVALVVVLILLGILTMLAVAGANTATAELAMAGNEQLRKRASDAASAGIEQALARLRARPASGSSTSVTETSAYRTTTRYAGEEIALPQSGSGRMLGRHYVIESTGRSARGAIDVQIQGAIEIAPATGVTTYGRIGSGLQAGASP